MLRTFYACTLANRNDLYFLRNAGGELVQSELSPSAKGVVRCVKSTQAVAAPLNVVVGSCGMVGNAHKYRLADEQAAIEMLQRLSIYLIKTTCTSR